MVSAGPDPVRYGVIGTGMMGVEHIQNVLALDGTSVTAVSDPHPTSLEWARAAVGERADASELAVFSDHRELLASGRCDVVVVATPNMTHHDVLVDVFDHDVHVLIEKPLCTTLADCRDVVDRVAALPAERIVWMGLEYRYLPPVRRLMEEIDAGTIGMPRMVAIREHRFPFLPKVGDWNRFSRNTGGTLVEKCCHFFDLMLRATGARPVRVYASGAQDVNHLDERYDGEVPDILDNAFVVVDFDSGARGMLDLCMFAEASKNEREVVVVGDRGKLEALDTESLVRIGRRTDDIVSGINVVTEERVVDTEVRHVGLHHGSSFLEHLDLLAAIRGGGPARVTVLDGLWSAAVGIAAHRSIESGRPVELAELPELADLPIPGRAGAVEEVAG